MPSTGGRNGRSPKRCPARRVESPPDTTLACVSRGVPARNASKNRRSLNMNKLAFATLCFLAAVSHAEDRNPLDVTSLPDTKPLTRKGDIAAELVAGVDKF